MAIELTLQKQATGNEPAFTGLGGRIKNLLRTAWQSIKKYLTLSKPLTKIDITADDLSETRS